MTSSDSATQLRRRQSGLADVLASISATAQTVSPSVVCKTKTVATYPTVANRYYACAPAVVTGSEVEGGAAIVTAATTTLYALNLGTAIPSVGKEVLVTFAENRWVFRYDG